MRGDWMSEQNKLFHTYRGYELMARQRSMLTPSMEDYLEMAYRLCGDKGYTRIGDIAAALQVQPPSATSMVQKLAEMGYLRYEKYGIIELTEQGEDVGAYLLHRHKVIESFLILIGAQENLLVETEKIEHNLGPDTIKRIALLVQLLQENQPLLTALRNNQE